MIFIPAFCKIYRRWNSRLSFYYYLHLWFRNKARL